jgi:asparagine synthase (glutamine-hydrolysing)
LNSEFFKNFERLARETVLITDGCLDVCNSHDLFLNRLARQIAPVRLTGKFGSEIVRDRTMFKPAAFDLALLDSESKRYVKLGKRSLEEVRRGNSLTMSAFKELPWNEQGKLTLEQSQVVLRTPYMDNELVKLCYQEPLGLRASADVQVKLIQKINSELTAIPTNRGPIVCSNKIVSGASKIFYHALLKFDYLYLFGTSPWLARATALATISGMAGLLLGYQKFELYRVWFRRELSTFVKDILLDDSTLSRPYFDRRFVERMVAAHIKGDRNYVGEINKALTLELICRELLKPVSAAPFSAAKGATMCQSVGS